MACHRLFFAIILVVLATTAFANKSNDDKLEGNTGSHGKAASQTIQYFLSKLPKECYDNAIKKCGPPPPPSGTHPRQYMTCLTGHAGEFC